MRGRGRSVTAAGLIALAAVLVQLGCGYARGAALVLQATGTGGVAGVVANWNARQYSEESLAFRTRHGETRGRLYKPAGRIARTVVLVPGVHAGGIEEPRLVGFARNLAAAGLGVFTPELIDLKRYEVTPTGTDAIEDAARWVIGRPDLAPDRKVGLMGISFGGGLSVVAAGRPGLRDQVAFTLSFGGHADFPRVLRYLCTGTLSDGSYRAPHDYGVVIILLAAADRLVPADQVGPLRDAIRTFLNASHLAMVDRVKAEAEFTHARTLEATLAEPAATLLGEVNRRDVKALGARLLPHVEAFAADPALSAERSTPPASPVYLLHGADDNVIPALESTRLEQHLRAKTDVHRLISPLITHAEVDRSSTVMDFWRLITFWAGVLSE